MKLAKILMTGLLPLAFTLACGGTASDSGGDGDRRSTSGDGDGDTSGRDVADASTSSEGKDDECEAFCEQVASCDGSDADDCIDGCTNNATTSEAGQIVINECFSDDLCEFDLESTGSQIAILCLITEAGDITISDAADTYCNESVDAINACSDTEPAESEIPGNCEDTIGLASDELLDSLNECAGESCEDMQGCLELAVLSAVPLGVLEAGVTGEDELSPQLVADILAIGIVFSHLGLDEGDVVDQTNLGGAGGL